MAVTQPVPLPPIVKEVSEEELAALRLCRGGHTTFQFTDENILFEQMEERGFVKSSSFGTGQTDWKLSGIGLRLAYPDDADFELVGKESRPG